MSFPIDLSQYRPVVLDPSRSELTADEASALRANVELCRDAIVLFTAVAGARGLGGHTGGAFDIVPELLIADGFMRGATRSCPICWDEAGHRVAAQYLLSVLRGTWSRSAAPIPRGGRRPAGASRAQFHARRGVLVGSTGPPLALRQRRRPRRTRTSSASSSAPTARSRRATPPKPRAWRWPRSSNVKLLIDVNDVTIAGFPSDYMPGFDVGATLGRRGLAVRRRDGEDVEQLYAACSSDAHRRPGRSPSTARWRPACPDIEGETHGHDVIARGSRTKYSPSATPTWWSSSGRRSSESHTAVYLGFGRRPRQEPRPLRRHRLRHLGRDGAGGARAPRGGHRQRSGRVLRPAPHRQAPSRGLHPRRRAGARQLLGGGRASACTGDDARASSAPSPPSRRW